MPSAKAAISPTVLAAALCCIVAIGGCGSRAESNAGDSDAIRDAVERRVASTTTTEPPTTTEPAATTAEPAAGTGVEADPGSDRPTLTTDEVALIYSQRSPVHFFPDDIGEGDLLVMETACSVLMAATDEAETTVVYDTFESWFNEQLVEAGAPPEYLHAWDPRGMLDMLTDLGCVHPSTSPVADHLG